MAKNNSQFITHHSPLKKGYKQTEVGVIPEDWEVEYIKDISTSYSGGTPNTSNINFYGNEIPFIASGELNQKRIRRTSKGITNQGLINSSAKIVEKGTLLIAMYGATAGITAITEIKGAINQAVLAILTKAVDSEYLFNWFLLNKEKIISVYTQGGQPNLSGSLIKQIKIPLPPTRAEQTAIATALSDMDALIEGLEKLIAKKQNIKQGAMQELLKPKEGWEEKLLPKVCWFQEGPGVRNSQFTTAGVKLLNGTNIEKGKLLLEKTDRFISDNEAYGWYSHFLIDVKDILIACSGVTIDKFHEKVTIAEKKHLPLCMNTSTMRFKVKSKELSKDFLFHFLKSSSFKEQIGGKATGSAQLNFGPSHVSKVTISLPILQEQTRIAQILSDMDSEIEKLETQLSKYKMIKTGMMQELLTGKKRLV